ncbi:MAG TPA: TetR/AcrR family transcriptional regulator [Pseudonocardia sp.]|jgi:AcrR family transcriptional regulator|uniref:TetR/AcrR family transcriptional regulator n=1 Tax=Pseudonocardia sp. TaxID=60912 RepID=UPI002B6C1AC0|nr:TetR/AcrR family transcriptional regulator [Pseudonocardia sp.]HTF49757.1 TetR/AcrR family transcriptional regulator [Pseudonocardia sp.]
MTNGSNPRAGAAPLNRVERRKAQTRKKLINAARAMLADDTAPQASVQEITEAADVGFGSFYNHFSSKPELFEAAVADVLDELGELLDQLSVDVEDPALSFAQSLRLTLRLCRGRPEISAVLIRHGMNYMESQQGLAPRALRDIRAGMAAGRFRAADPRLARAAVAGALLATLQLALTDPDLVDDSACDQLAEQMLRMLGTPYDEAHALAYAPLPVAELPEPE